jgi:glycosyltransferase involved in cell wall biosynthesis/ribosomal protein S18 acetylase RimI-like enzyme
MPHYDIVVYNLGDHVGFHADIYEISQNWGGIVVLHDRVLHNLFAGHWFGQDDSARYVERMEMFYGSAGRRAAEGAVAGLRPPVWESLDDLVRFPLFEEALVGAEGVVVHSEEHASQVAGRWFGPVRALFLPAYPSDLARIPSEPGDQTPLTILTIGHVNPNKQVREVVEILADDRVLAEQVRYEVIGPYDGSSRYVHGLQSLIRTNNLEESVRVRGYLPDEELQELLASADVFVNLRYPTMESSSGSLIEELTYGRPVVVSDSGAFGEMPEGTVMKVPPGNRAALAETLTQLLEDRELRLAIGAAARSYAEQATTARYATELVSFVEEVRSARLVLGLADLAATNLRQMEVDSTLPVADSVGAAIAEIFRREIDRIGNGPGPIFRELGTDDLGPLTRLLAANDDPSITATFDPFGMTPETARKIALKPRRDRFYGAYVDGELAGLSMLRGWDDGYDVPSFGIFVDGAAQNQGLGASLTDFTLEQARMIGCESVRLSVYASNRIAHKMYERRDFIEIERQEVRRGGGTVDERIVMIKNFDSAKGDPKSGS